MIDWSSFVSAKWQNSATKILFRKTRRSNVLRSRWSMRLLISLKRPRMWLPVSVKLDSCNIYEQGKERLVIRKKLQHRFWLASPGHLHYSYCYSVLYSGRTISSSISLTTLGTLTVLLSLRGVVCGMLGGGGLFVQLKYIQVKKGDDWIIVETKWCQKPEAASRNRMVQVGAGLR